MRRLLLAVSAGAVLTVAVLVGVWLAPSPAVSASTTMTTSSQSYYGTVNEQRAWGFVQGLRGYKSLPLAGWSETLARCAHRHAERMAAAQDTFHGTPCPPYYVTQDVGMGGSPFTIYEAFLGSPKHRAPIIDGRLHALGVGVAHRNGTYYLVYDFAARR